MRVLVQSTLPCDADLAWGEVQTLALLRKICWPLIRLKPASADAPIPAQWRHGETVRMKPFLFGIVPLGVRQLYWEQIDNESRCMQTREHDPLIRRWDHRIAVVPVAARSCRYTDDVEIDAGVLTVPVWLFAQWFYRHRQRRWQAVARRLQARAAAQAALPVSR
jgi:hypothetical protein